MNLREIIQSAFSNAFLPTSGNLEPVEHDKVEFFDYTGKTAKPFIVATQPSITGAGNLFGCFLEINSICEP